MNSLPSFLKPKLLKFSSSDLIVNTYLFLDVSTATLTLGNDSFNFLRVESFLSWMLRGNSKVG